MRWSPTQGLCRCIKISTKNSWVGDFWRRIFFSELTKVRVLPMSDDDYSDESDTDVFLKKPSFVGEDWSLCTKCESFRPPRAHHCRICRRCIRKMDHHCKFFQKFNQNLNSKISKPFLTQKIKFFLNFELKNSFWIHSLSQIWFFRSLGEQLRWRIQSKTFSSVYFLCWNFICVCYRVGFFEAKIIF